VWSTQVGPGGHLGGIHWGTATDGTRIYTENNAEGSPPPAFALGGKGKLAGQMVTTGVWSALDPNSGDILWQIPNPVLTVPNSGASCNGPVAVTNGVLFAGSMDSAGTMFALNAATGDVLWSFVSGGTVYGGPAIVNGVVYWGSGYPNGSGARPLGFGTSSLKLYAFALGLGGPDGGAPDGSAEAGVVTDAAAEAAEDAVSPGDSGGQ
jgi:polyvinyl alcohol dehydrogenase (cytochrome)